MLNLNELNLDDLEDVVGGVNSAEDIDPSKKLQELKDAAKALGLDIPPHTLEAIADLWEKTGFKGNAEKILEKYTKSL